MLILLTVSWGHTGNPSSQCLFKLYLSEVQKVFVHVSNVFVHIDEKCHTGHPNFFLPTRRIEFRWWVSRLAFLQLSLMQLWPEPERGPQRSPLKASSEVCTGFLRCTPLGLEKGSGFCKQMHAVSAVQCSAVQKANRESHSAIDISQLWCAFYRLCAFECCAFGLNPRYATVHCAECDGR